MTFKPMKKTRYIALSVAILGLALMIVLGSGQNDIGEDKSCDSIRIIYDSDLHITEDGITNIDLTVQRNGTAQYIQYQNTSVQTARSPHPDSEIFDAVISKLRGIGYFQSPGTIDAQIPSGCEGSFYSITTTCDGDTRAVQWGCDAVSSEMLDIVNSVFSSARKWPPIPDTTKLIYVSPASKHGVTRIVESGAFPILRVDSLPQDLQPTLRAISQQEGFRTITEMEYELLHDLSKDDIPQIYIQIGETLLEIILFMR